MRKTINLDIDLFFFFVSYFFSIAQFASGAQIILDSNPLTALTQDAFEPVLNYFIAKGYSTSNTSVSINNTSEFTFNIFLK